jgi:alpha-L-fucosidase
VDGGYSLTHENVISEEGNMTFRGYDRRGTIPPHIVVEDKYQSSWKIYVDQPGIHTIDVSYSCQEEKPKGKITVIAAKTSLNHEIKPTGLTVGEPNSDWHIDNFLTHHLGTINFVKPGIYEIYMEIDADKKTPVKFQWMWVTRKN